MNSTNWIIGLVVLVIIGGGAWYFTQSPATGDAMMHDEGAMATTSDAMMASTSDQMMASSSESMSATTSVDAMMH